MLKPLTALVGSIRPKGRQYKEYSKRLLQSEEKKRQLQLFHQQYPNKMIFLKEIENTQDFKDLLKISENILKGKKKNQKAFIL